ncbi:glycosyltransferase [Patescibacteria group bacterium]|nr:glycosyltransferase [Patescibacteria group bacterium]
MLSIIIPTLNEEEYLPKLLNCLQSQKLKDDEIIVSDGDSKDNTVKIAKKHGCQVIISTKLSPAHQRNKGAQKAKGDLLLFLDADTLLPANFFQSVLKEFKKRKLDVASFYFKLNSNKLTYKIASVFGYINCFLFHRIHPISIGAGILAKKQYHKKIGGFDESLLIGEDHLYSASIKKSGGKFGLIKSRKILFSTRRFKKEGFFKVLFKWYYMTFYFLIRGPIKKKVIKYEFGNY